MSKDLKLRSYQERLLQTVARYEEEISDLRVEATETVERLQRKVEELEAKIAETADKPSDQED